MGAKDLAAVVLFLAGAAGFYTPPAAHGDAAMAADTPCPDPAGLEPQSSGTDGEQLRRGLALRAYYPREALGARQTGSVTLCVLVDRKGRVQQAQVARSSGFPILDAAALSMAGIYQSRGGMSGSPPNLPVGQDSEWLALPLSFAPPPKEGTNDLRAEPGPCAQHPREPLQMIEGNPDPELARYIQAMSLVLTTTLRYPYDALESGTSGDVLLCLSMDRASHLADATIRHSSGILVLDGEALRTVGAAQLKYTRLPPLPASALTPDKDYLLMGLELHFKYE